MKWKKWQNPRKKEHVALWKHFVFRTFFWRDARSEVPVPSRCIPNVIKRFPTVFPPPAKSSSNLRRHKLIRSAEVWKQRSLSNTPVRDRPTWYASAQVQYQTHTFHPSPSGSPSIDLLAYLVPRLNCSWGWRVGLDTASRAPTKRKKKKRKTLQLKVHYLLRSWQTYGLSGLNQISSREDSNPPHPLPSPPLSSPSPSRPPQIGICGDEWHIYFSTKVVCM